MNSDAANLAAGSWFLGEFEYTVDSQRRIAVPSQWRRAAPDENSFFLLPGREKSVQIVPAETFRELLMKLRKVSFADSQAAVAMATIGSMAQDCRCDRQGRITLPPRLMEHAGIDDRALLIGAVTTIQVWNPEAWKERRMHSDAGLDVIQAIQERGDNLTEILSQAARHS